MIFENDINGFSRLLKTADEIKWQNNLSKIVYGLESTGNYHKPLASYLIRCGSNVVLVSGEAVKKNRSLLDGRFDQSTNRPFNDLTNSTI